MANSVWLLTWTTYGTWLPGDNRGFMGYIRQKQPADSRQRLDDAPRPHDANQTDDAHRADDASRTDEAHRADDASRRVPPPKLLPLVARIPPARIAAPAGNGSNSSRAPRQRLPPGSTLPKRGRIK